MTAAARSPRCKSTPPTGTRPRAAIPAETELVVSRKTGELKHPEGERRVFRMNGWVTLGAIAVAYILAKIICG